MNDYWRLPFSCGIDDEIAMGHAVNVHRDGAWTQHAPLVPAVGDVVATRVRYRCALCPGPVVARVTDYVAEATGEKVLLFTGHVFRDLGTDHAVGLTIHAFLWPDLGTAPRCMCSEHGELEVTATDALAHAHHSVAIQTGNTYRTADQSATVTKRLLPCT